MVWISLLGGEGEQWLEPRSAVKQQLSESNRLDVACWKKRRVKDYLYALIRAAEKIEMLLTEMSLIIVKEDSG